MAFFAGKKTTLTTHNSDIDIFILKCFSELEKSNIEVLLSLNNYVICPVDNEKCNGFFDDEEKLFAVSICHPLDDWFEIFIHEYCHFEQWKDKIPEWNTQNDENNMQFIELDCERRVIKKIKEFSLPIDPIHYAKKSAAYVMFYSFILKHKKWYAVGKEPYRNEKILKLMPDNLDGELIMTPEVEELYKQCI